MKETHEHAVKRGKKSRAAGGIFELRVRKDLEAKGWIVTKWTNNVEMTKLIDEIEPHDVSFMPDGTVDLAYSVKKSHIEGKIVPSKHKFRGPGIPMAIGTGFPDFLAWKNLYDSNTVTGIEVKSNGYLDKTEKEKCRWYLNNNIFTSILIASKTKIKNRIVIVYKEFK